MSEVNKINLNNTLFDIEDTVARENITTMQANIANNLDACSLVAEEDKSIAGAYAVQQLNNSLGRYISSGTPKNGNVSNDQIIDRITLPAGVWLVGFRGRLGYSLSGSNQYLVPGYILINGQKSNYIVNNEVIIIEAESTIELIAGTSNTVYYQDIELYGVSLK